MSRAEGAAGQGGGGPEGPKSSQGMGGRSGAACLGAPWSRCGLRPRTGHTSRLHRLAAIPSPVRWAGPPCLRWGGHGLRQTSPETGPWMSIYQGLLLEGDRHTGRGKQVRDWEEQRPRVLCSPPPPPPAAGKWQPGPEARDPDSPLLVSGRKLRRSSCHLAAPHPGPLPPTLFLVSDLFCRPPSQSVSVRGATLLGWQGSRRSGVRVH